jgi:hypothetical protein
MNATFAGEFSLTVILGAVGDAASFSALTAWFQK